MKSYADTQQFFLGLWNDYKATFLSFLIITIVGFWVGNLIVNPDVKGILLLILIPLTLIIFISNKAALYIIIFGIFSLNSLAGWNIIPRQLTWLPDLAILILALKVAYLIQLKKVKIQRTPIDFTFLTLIVVTIFSSIANSLNIFTALAGFRHFFKYILMFYLLMLLDLDEKILKRTITIVLGLAFLQIPIAIFQRIFVNQDDLVAGTLGWNANQELSLFLIGIMGILFGFFYQRYKNKTGLYLVGMTLILIPITLNQAKAAFLYLLAVMIFIFLQYFLKRPRKMISVALIFILIFAGVVFSADKIIPRVNISKFIMDTSGILEYTFGPGYRHGDYIALAKGGTLRRGSAIIYAHRLISNKLLTALIGVGPGNASESFFSSATGEYFSDLEPAKIQFSRTLLEYGYLGFILFLIMFTLLYKKAQQIKDKLEDEYWKAISIGFTVVFFLHITGVLYIQNWTSDVLSFWFWFLAAAILIVGKRKKAYELK